jgi:hypothetical protein
MLVTYQKHRLWLAAASALCDSVSVKDKQSGEAIPANTPCFEELKTKIRELLEEEADIGGTLPWDWLEQQLPDLRAHVRRQQQKQTVDKWATTCEQVEAAAMALRSRSQPVRKRARTVHEEQGQQQQPQPQPGEQQVPTQRQRVVLAVKHRLLLEDWYASLNTQDTSSEDVLARCIKHFQGFAAERTIAGWVGRWPTFPSGQPSTLEECLDKLLQACQPLSVEVTGADARQQQRQQQQQQQQPRRQRPPPANAAAVSPVAAAVSPVAALEVAIQPPPTYLQQVSTLPFATAKCRCLGTASVLGNLLTRCDTLANICCRSWLPLSTLCRNSSARCSAHHGSCCSTGSIGALPLLTATHWSVTTALPPDPEVSQQVCLALPAGCCRQRDARSERFSHAACGCSTGHACRHWCTRVAACQWTSCQLMKAQVSCANCSCLSVAAMLAFWPPALTSSLVFTLLLCQPVVTQAEEQWVQQGLELHNPTGMGSWLFR